MSTDSSNVSDETDETECCDHFGHRHFNINALVCEDDSLRSACSLTLLLDLLHR